MSSPAERECAENEVLEKNGCSVKHGPSEE